MAARRAPGGRRAAFACFAAVMTPVPPGGPEHPTLAAPPPPSPRSCMIETKTDTLKIIDFGAAATNVPANCAGAPDPFYPLLIGA